MTRALDVAMAGERATLLADGALWLPALGTLLVADVHWGKGATFRARGIPVPPGSTARDLARLATLVAETGAERLVVLGDLVHAREGWEGDTLAAALAWRAAHAALDLVLVVGNHDARAGSAPAALRITEVAEPWALGPWQLAHHPPGDGGYAVPATGHLVHGHVHPAVRLAGLGRAHATLPAFIVGERRTILPSFGSFTGRSVAALEPGDRAYVIAEREVIEVPVVG